MNVKFTVCVMLQYISFAFIGSKRCQLVIYNGVDDDHVPLQMLGNGSTYTFERSMTPIHLPRVVRKTMVDHGCCHHHSLQLIKKKSLIELLARNILTMVETDCFHLNATD
ncbi:hypothetical protein BLOT_002973 [Blomia tropicalis]|nr:hypothetical protein BLOT_002973 [Blomia tropicalis]